MSSDHSPVASFVDSVHLGPRQACKQITLWPLIRTLPLAHDALDYAPLCQALAEGWLEIDEVDREGSVPHVRVRNRGKKGVLILFGEELVGAKQNRIANASFLIGAGQDVAIDVSCVEQGRWHRDGRDRAHAGFDRAGAVMSMQVRKRMAKKVSASRAAGVGYRADQAEVWDQVGERLSVARAESPTRAYDDYLQTRRTDLAEIRRAFRPAPDQVGFVVQIGDAIAGAEAIGRPEVFATCFERLVDACAIDAIDAAASASIGSPTRAPTEPEALLSALRDAPAAPAPSLGLGRDLRIETALLSGCALENEELVHLTVSTA